MPELDPSLSNESKLLRIPCAAFDAVPSSLGSGGSISSILLKSYESWDCLVFTIGAY